MRRWVSLLLCLLMVFTILPTAAFADGDVIDGKTDDPEEFTLDTIPDGEDGLYTNEEPPSLQEKAAGDDNAALVYQGYRSEEEQSNEMLLSASDFTVERVGSDRISVQAGQTAQLAVKASPDDGDFTYTWEKTESGESSPTAISDAAGSTLTTDPIWYYAEYTCWITDTYGTVKGVSFFVYPENHLTIAPVDDAAQASAGDSATYVATEGNAVYLEVTADADDRNDLTFQWYVYDERQDEETEIPGATYPGLLYYDTAQDSILRCYVTDFYGNREYAQFTVIADNNLRVSPVGEREITILPGQDVRFQVKAEARNTEGIRYQWCESVLEDGERQKKPIAGATAADYTMSGLQRGGKWICVTTDAYGTEVNTWFTVEVKNDLRVQPAEGETYRTVQPGDNVTLTVEASAADAAGLSYTWYRFGRVESGEYRYTPLKTNSAAPQTLSLENIQRGGEYVCIVEDRYHNQQELWYTLNVENHLQLFRNGDYVLEVQPGGSIEASVEVLADNKEGMTYHWTLQDDNTGTYVDLHPEDSSVPALTLGPVYHTFNLYCVAEDCYGNEESLWINVCVDNGFMAYGGGYYTVERGQCITLTKHATARDERGMTYQWCVGVIDPTLGYAPEMQRIPDANTNTITTEPITQTVEYLCKVMDRFGNSSQSTFWVGPENHLALVGDETQYVYVSAGDDVVLAPAVTADDADALYYEWFVWNSEVGYYEALEGLTDATYEIPNIQGAARLQCQIRDKYGNTVYVCYDVGIENHLRVAALGDTNLRVGLGTAVTLQVEAGADNMTGLTYRWYRVDADTHERSEPMDGVQSEDGTLSTFETASITQWGRYICVVTDCYGTEREIYFEIAVDNHLQLDAVDDIFLRVALGETVTLKTAVSGLDLSDLTYQWSLENPETDCYEDIHGATGPDYTIDHVDRAMLLSCSVQDRFGNYASRIFRVEVENHLELYPLADPVFVAPGQKATAAVRAEADDMTGLTYQWFTRGTDKYGNTRFVEIPGATGTSYTTGPIYEATDLLCRVTDRYGNFEQRPITVEVDNQLTLRPVGETYLRVKQGDSATLQVQVNAQDTTGLTLRWYRAAWDEYYKGWTRSYAIPAIPGADGNIFAVRNILYPQGYWCEVADRFGGTRMVLFIIVLDAAPRFNDGNATTYYVKPNGTVTLIAYMAYGNTDGLTFVWQDEEGNVLKESGANRFAAQNVTQVTRYRCTAYSDAGEAECWYTVIPDNALQVRPIGKSSFRVASGMVAPMRVKATADDTSALEYQWYIGRKDATGSITWDEKDAIPDAISDTYYASGVEKSTIFVCQVSDQYGASRSAAFTVGPETGLRAAATGGSARSVAQGSVTALQVDATIDEGYGTLSYRWYNGDGFLLTGVTGAGMVTAPITDATTYTCYVSDQYGNEETVTYTLTPNAKASGAFSGDMAWTLEKNGTLSIIGNGVVPAGKPWASHQSDITAIRLGKGISGIEENAFSGCENVEDVYISAYETDSWFTAADAGLDSVSFTTHYLRSVQINQPKVASSTGSDSVTTTIVDANNTGAALSVEDGIVTLSGVTDGTYTMQVAQEGCVARNVPIKVTEEGVEMPEEIKLVKVGNLNGAAVGGGDDVGVDDMQCLYEYLSANNVTGQLENDLEYFEAVADVNSDGGVNILDYQSLYDIIPG